MKQQPAATAVDSELLTSIKGFEEWTRSMIKDFIDCMGKARQKYNTLKEQNPNTEVGLIQTCFCQRSRMSCFGSYQMWFCQKLLKNAKYNSQIVKIWRFLWNPHLVALKSSTSSSHTNRNYRTGSQQLWHYQKWLFTKISKIALFDCYFWHFWAIFGKTTSGSSPKQDNLNLWAVHVWFDQ